VTRTPLRRAVMMHLSARFLSRFGLLFITVFAVGCAQSGAGAPSSPSSVGPSSAAVGPSAGYDATGMWHFVQTSSNPNLVDTWDQRVVQDPVTGNLTVYSPDNEEIILERLSEGNGAVIVYSFGPFTSVEGSDPCDILRVKGTARLDTTTNTITLPIRLKQLGDTSCSNGRAGAVITGTKLS
jgi:hypothetical protein